MAARGVTGPGRLRAVVVGRAGRAQPLEAAWPGLASAARAVGPGAGTAATRAAAVGAARWGRGGRCRCRVLRRPAQGSALPRGSSGTLRGAPGFCCQPRCRVQGAAEAKVGSRTPRVQAENPRARVEARPVARPTGDGNSDRKGLARVSPLRSAEGPRVALLVLIFFFFFLLGHSSLAQQCCELPSLHLWHLGFVMVARFVWSRC